MEKLGMTPETGMQFALVHVSKAAIAVGPPETFVQKLKAQGWPDAAIPQMWTFAMECLPEIKVKV